MCCVCYIMSCYVMFWDVMLCHIMSCYVILWYVTLSSATLCYVILCCGTLHCYVMLWYVKSHHDVLCYVGLCSANTPYCMASFFVWLIVWLVGWLFCCFVLFVCFCLFVFLFSGFVCLVVCSLFATKIRSFGSWAWPHGGPEANKQTN